MATPAAMTTSPHRHMRLGMIAIGGILLAALLGWAAGFVWFINTTARPAVPPPKADGIVALTGGAERIEAALRLLAGGHADKLLVSGIGGSIDVAALAHRAGVDPVPLTPRVTLGRSATSTHGNAVETAAWARANNIRSIIVVTAYYHMPRAMTELRREVAGISLFPYPVLNPERGNTVPIRLMAEEYSKFLLTTAGVSAWLPAREPAHGGNAG